MISTLAPNLVRGLVIAEHLLFPSNTIPADSRVSYARPSPSHHRLFPTHFTDTSYDLVDPHVVPYILTSVYSAFVTWPLFFGLSLCPTWLLLVLVSVPLYLVRYMRCVPLVVEVTERLTS